MASGKAPWVQEIREASPQHPIFEGLHSQLLNQLRTFHLIGGMPAVVAEFVASQDLLRCQNVLNDILVSFYNDFAKYKKRVPAIRIKEVFEQAGERCVGTAYHGGFGLSRNTYGGEWHTARRRNQPENPTDVSVRHRTFSTDVGIRCIGHPALQRL